MVLFWGNSLEGIGNAYGYSVHYKSLRAALDKIGVKEDFSSDIAIHIATAYAFKPFPNKKNILYTMYECTSLPKAWIEPINKADALLVPCKHNKELFAQYFKKGYNNIYVVPEGCDTETFKYVKRNFPKNDIFQFLWVGAPNMRKGYIHTGLAWVKFLERNKHLKDKVFLYMKTTGIKEEKIQYPPQKVNLLVDSRDLTKEELYNLYKNSHAFILPSMGEGWGLTLIEAAASGLPCIYVHYSGTADFMDKKYSYWVKWQLGKVSTLKKIDEKGNTIIEHESYAAHPDIESICQRMEQIYYNYDEALRKAEKQSQIIRQNFTWEQSALKFCEAIKDYATKNNLYIG